MSHTLKAALLGLWRERWVNILSMMTIGSALLLMLIAGFFVYNLDIAARDLPDRFTVMVFFKDSLSDAEARQGSERIRNIGVVSGVRYIPAEEALAELREAMNDADYVLEGLDENPLPASAEVRLKKEHVTDEGVEELSTRLATIDEVADVQYGDKLLEVIRTIQRYTETLGGALVLLLGVGVLFVCYSTVKILFYRKREEIATLKFLGATRGFIRAPFVIEGGVLGLGGGVFSAGTAIAVYFFVFAPLAESFPVFSNIQFPSALVALSFPVGLLVGVTGAVIAVGRIRF